MVEKKENKQLPSLDPILHQPVRTRICAFLVARGATSFTELKQTLGMSDGNLESHIKKLVQEEYIIKARETGKGRPQTIYMMSEKGEEQFKCYVEQLQALLNIEK